MFDIETGTDLKSLNRTEIEEWLRTNPRSETQNWDDAKDYIEALNAGDTIVLALFGKNMVIERGAVGEDQSY